MHPNGYGFCNHGSNAVNDEQNNGGADNGSSSSGDARPTSGSHLAYGRDPRLFPNIIQFDDHGTSPAQGLSPPSGR
eukprot:7697899-Karenia_brevis.AAC.1